MLGALALAAAALWLSWIDVLPGGWTLRGWVEPHPQREARARLEYEASRREHFAAVRGEARAGSIFFGGSSTIERFPYHWFREGHLINRGINDEPVEHFAARWEASLPEAPIGGAVLYPASVDFRRLLASPSEVELRVRKLLGAWRARFPDLPILVLGIYPETQMPLGWSARLAETNRVIRLVCTEFGVDHLELNRPPLIDDRGDLSAAFAADAWHMNHAGYRQMMAWLADEYPAWWDRLEPLDADPAGTEAPTPASFR